VGFSPSGPVKANRGVRAGVPAAGKVLEGDDQRTLSPLYYDSTRCLSRSFFVFGVFLYCYTDMSVLFYFFPFTLLKVLIAHVPLKSVNFISL